MTLRCPIGPYLYFAALFVGVASSAQTVAPTQLAHVSRCSFEGEVVDKVTLKPIEGASVRLNAGRHSPIMTEASGHFSFDQVPCGTYGVFAEKEGYPRYPEIHRVRLAQESVAHITLKLAKEAGLSGRLVDSERSPIGGVMVEVWSQALVDGKMVYALRGSARTDQEGKYRVPGLAGGDYLLSAHLKSIRVEDIPKPAEARAKSKLSIAGTFFPGVQSIDQAAPIHIRPSEERQGIDLTLTRQRSFCVVASLAGSFPEGHNANPTVMLFESGTGWYDIVGSGAVAPEKQFAMCGLTAGIQYHIAAAMLDGEELTGVFGERVFIGTSTDAKRGSFDLGPIRLDRGQDIAGQITIFTHPEEKPPLGLAMLLPVVRPEFRGESLVSHWEQTGDFVFRSVFPYEHWLTMLVPQPYYIKQAQYDNHDLKTEPWQPGRGEIHVVLSDDGASIYGQVNTSESKPNPDAHVLIMSKESLDPHSLRTFLTKADVDQDGQFQTSGLPPGVYLVAAVTDLTQDELQDPRIVRRSLLNGQELTVNPYEHKSVVLTAE